MARWDAIGIGIAVRDFTVSLNAFPESDEKVDTKAMFESGGGPVPTALVTLARLGNRTSFMGIVGRDAVGQFLIKGLEEESVDLRWMQYRDGFQTPTSVILVENGRRTILEAPKTSTGTGLPLTKRDLEALPLEQCRALLVDARAAAIQVEAAKRVRASGGLVMLDCGHPRPGVGTLLAHTDIAILSHSYPRALEVEDYETSRFLDELQAKLPQDGPAIAGVTLGADGCMIQSQDTELIRIPGHPVEALDTTGAGDVFHGSFLYALLETGSVEKSARFANLCAGSKCRGMTGRAPIPTDREIWDELSASV